MKKYDEYKDSGVEWIGEVPRHWEVVHLKQVLKGIQDGTHGTYQNVESDNVLLSAKNVTDVGLNIGDYERTISDNDYAEIISNGFPQNGDILVCCVGTLGRCCIFNSSKPIAFQRSVTFLRVGRMLSNKVLLYILRNNYIQTQFTLFAKTSAQSGVYLGDLKNFYITLPPLSEQHAIATYLDKKCCEIDKVISVQQKRIALLQELKQSVITHAVTKGLNPNVEMKESGVEWIGEVPRHWEIMKIKNLKSKAPNAFVDGPFGSNLKSQHFIENGDVYVIESGMITTGKFVYKDFKTISKKHFNTIQRSECREGDIIIAKIGMNFGMAGELPKLDKPSVVSGNSLKLTLDRNKMRNQLFVYLFSVAKRCGGYVGLVQETAQPALSLGGLNNFTLPVAPMKEQLEIEKHLIRRCTTIDSSISKAQHQIDLLQEYKQSLITEVVTGKRKVCL